MLLGCLAAYLLAGLFGRGLWKADEPYSFGMVWNFLTTPDWLIPRVGDAPFMEKPPLMYWTGALAARLSAPWLSAPDGARLAVLGWCWPAAGARPCSPCWACSVWCSTVIC